MLLPRIPGALLDDDSASNGFSSGSINGDTNSPNHSANGLLAGSGPQTRPASGLNLLMERATCSEKRRAVLFEKRSEQSLL